MLFSSPIFLFAFLPVVLAALFSIARKGLTWQKTFLLAASLFFYGWWEFGYVFLLLLSIAANYLIATRILSNGPNPERARRWLVAGLALNLALIGYYKYFNFFVDNINALFGDVVPHFSIILPIGISFFTFQQIAFLVDAYKGKVEHTNPLDYGLFVTFFPQLIAGPIVHHSDVMPQFARRLRLEPHYFSTGASLFTIGLFKKLVVADGLAPIANFVFGQADKGEPLTAAVSAIGLLAYTFQLYFDFSGYSDMAIGLGLMMGIRLPINFLSPYKAASVIDFWRRWHITLSRFLRDYLYIPLGGNRKGKVRRYINLMITMLLGGLWHGASWNFVIWGGLHGLYLMINHAWNAVRERRSLPHLPRPAGLALTFGGVIMAWAFFRAETLSGALSMLSALVDPSAYVVDKESLKAVVKATGNKTSHVLALFAAAFVITFALPAASAYHLRALDGDARGAPAEFSRTFRADAAHFALFVIVWAAILFASGGANEFLYFQF